MPDAFGIALANEVSRGAIHKRRHLFLLGKGSNIEGKSFNKQEGGVKNSNKTNDVIYGWPPTLCSSTSHIGRSQQSLLVRQVCIRDRSRRPPPGGASAGLL